MSNVLGVYVSVHAAWERALEVTASVGDSDLRRRALTGAPPCVARYASCPESVGRRSNYWLREGYDDTHTCTCTCLQVLPYLDWIVTVSTLCARARIQTDEVTETLCAAG